MKSGLRPGGSQESHVQRKSLSLCRPHRDPNCASGHKTWPIGREIWQFGWLWRSGRERTEGQHVEFFQLRLCLWHEEEEARHGCSSGSQGNGWSTATKWVHPFPVWGPSDWHCLVGIGPLVSTGSPDWPYGHLQADEPCAAKAIVFGFAQVLRRNEEETKVEQSGLCFPCKSVLDLFGLPTFPLSTGRGPRETSQGVAAGNPSLFFSILSFWSFKVYMTYTEACLHNFWQVYLCTL